MTIVLLLISLFFSSFGAQEKLSFDARKRIHRETITVKYIKDHYLAGNAKRKIKILKSKIKKLDEKGSLSKNEKKRLAQLKKSLGKIVFWQKYSEQSLEICILSKKPVSPLPEPNDPIAGVYQKRAKLVALYPKLTQEKFPKGFQKQVDKLVSANLPKS